MLRGTSGRQVALFTVSGRLASNGGEGIVLAFAIASASPSFSAILAWGCWWDLKDDAIVSEVPNKGQLRRKKETRSGKLGLGG